MVLLVAEEQVLLLEAAVVDAQHKRDERLAARWGAECRCWLGDDRSMRALAARSAGRLTLTQRLRAENKAQDPQHQIKNGRLRPPTLSNTCVVPKWRSLVLTIDDAGSFSIRRAGLPQGFVSRVSARKELRKPTTGWGGGRRGGRVCRWNWHRCTTARIPHGWPKTRDGRREVRASVGEVEGKKRLRPKRGTGKWEGKGGIQGLRAFRRYGRRQGPARTGRLAGHDWGDGGLARGSGKGRDGRPRQVRVDSQICTARGRNCSSLALLPRGFRLPNCQCGVSRRSKIYQNPLNPMPRSTSCVRQDGEDGWVLSVQSPSQSRPSSALQFASCDPRA